MSYAVVARKHRFRKQGIATPTRLPRWGPGVGAAKRVADIYCALPWRSDQAWSSRRWSAPRFVHWRRRAAFIVACTAAPGRRGAWLTGSYTRLTARSAQTVYARRRHQFAEVNHASDATRGAARKRIGRREIREAGAKHGLFDRWRHLAERCVFRVVELGSRKQPGVAVLRIDDCAKCEAEPGSQREVCLAAAGSDRRGLKPYATA